MHSIIVEKRRKRSINFTESDRQVLLELVKPHLSVIENKRTDKFTSKLKSETWENIKVQYNKLSTQPRTALQLKLFYEANKYKAKKKETSATQSDDSGESPTKIVKIEVETSSIMNILAKNDKPNNNSENSPPQLQSQSKSNERKDNSEAKIKVVDISKLRSTEPTPPDNVMAPISSTSENRLQDQVKMDNNLTKGESPSSTFLSDTLFPGPTASMQEDLHRVRMLILQDERNFRRQEHLKRMEYMDLNILALKSNILRQNT